MEATKFNAQGMASTKHMTSFTMGANRCSVTKTHMKGTKNCRISMQSLSRHSKHPRKEDPKTSIKARFRLAAFFRAFRHSREMRRALCRSSLMAVSHLFNSPNRPPSDSWLPSGSWLPLALPWTPPGLETNKKLPGRNALNFGSQKERYRTQ